MSLITTDFTVLDLETTGLNPRGGDRIIEIAGVKIVGGKIKEEMNFVSFVNPGRKISPGAFLVNKISQQDLDSAPPIEEVLPAFLEFVGDSILIAHNAGFDISFLEAEKEACWGYVDIPESICTLRLSRGVSPNEYGHNLDIVAKRLGIEGSAMRHRALPDVMITAQAFLKMISAGGIESLDGLREIAGLRTVARAS